MLNLEPKKLWEYFSRLSEIPRPSKHEKAAGDFVVSVAQAHGLEWKRDAVGNVLITVPATKGHEKAPVTVLQGHLDMVCEKNTGTKHDFYKDPIKLRVVGGVVKATGTTLGADNGIGVAMSLALLDEPRAVHGPLELLFTIDEETGLNGANGLKPSFLKGRRLLNLDTEEDGELYVGCAGGIDTHMTLRIARETKKSKIPAFRLTVAGLRGGHSGSDIHEGRGNANRLLARVLQAMGEADVAHQLVSFDGGSKHNAIPREAFAVLQLDGDAEKAAGKLTTKWQKIFRGELKGLDDGVTVKLSADKAELAPMKGTSAKKLVTLLGAIPHGLVSYSREIHGLVETSTNFATVVTSAGKITIGTSQRSSVDSQIAWVAQWVANVGRLAGAEIHQNDGYPGWKPDLDSKILKAAQKTYKRLFKEEPVPKAIHAGLECGIIGAKFPGMDMVSLGPEILNAHSPDEEVNIKSVQKTYKYLLELLKDIA